MEGRVTLKAALDLLGYFHHVFSKVKHSQTVHVDICNMQISYEILTKVA